jgi:hypothetical protein
MAYIQFSFSSLKTFQTCPRQYKHKYILKDVKDEGSDATRYGTAVHLAIEEFLTEGKPLPDEYLRYLPMIRPCVEWKGAMFVEHEMALGADFKPCAFRDPNYFVRGIADFVKVDGKKAYVLDWKGLPLDTEIPTPAGFTTMGALAVGDVVFAGNGKQCKVVGKSDIHNRPCFKIHFDDKTEVVCDEVHLWKLTDGQVLPVTELKVGDKIPVAGAVDIDNADLPLDPYVLGLWLADGTCGDGSITKPDVFVWDEIRRREYEIGDNISGRVGGCPTRTVYGIRGKLATLGVLHDKHIPEQYLFASYQQRLDLLRGLMDGDGNVNEVRKQAVFTTCDRRLSDQVKQLASSLGQRVNQSITEQRGFGLTVTAYPLAFRPQGMNPFLLPRKADRVGDWGAGCSWFRKITKVEPVESVPTQCIAVDSEDNTYLCTREFIVTHNTGKTAKFADTKQLELMALLVFKHFPDVEEVRGGLVFLVVDKIVQATFKRSDAKSVWLRWLHEVSRVEHAVDTDSFPPRPNNLCRAFCPVFSCEHNERMF